MDLTTLAAVILAALAAGGVAHVLLEPILSGRARAEKRQAALVGASPQKRVDRNASATNRREQVSQSLKDIEQRERDRNKVSIEMRIRQAGLEWTKNKFLVVSAAIGVGLGFAMFSVTGSLVMFAVGGAVGFLGVPRWLLVYLKKKRLNRFLEELPNAIDVIVRGIKSGLPLNDCLRIIASEAQEPVRSEFRHIIEQQTMGVPVPDAVGKLYERVPVAESNFFAIVLAIQSKAGGNLSEALGNLSRVLRDRRKMRAKIQAMSMEAKASAAIIGALPFLVGIATYITSPTYIELLWLTMTGKVALVISAFWMTFGMLVMKKMINFDF